MFIVERPRSDGDSAVRRESLALRCAICKRQFRTLTEVFMAYTLMAPGEKSIPEWGHRRCLEGAPLAKGVKRQLWRGDLALRALLETLVKPAIPLTALRDVPEGPRRPWCDP